MPGQADDDVIFTPSPEALSEGVLACFGSWLADRRGTKPVDYEQLWSWSSTDLEEFWDSVRAFFDLRVEQDSGVVLAERSMPGASWFPGARVNYVRQALRHRLDTPAVVALTEDGRRSELTWDELRGQVGALAQWLRAHGVGRGDRVVGYLPSVAASVVGFLATASIGAVWSACSPEYTAHGAADRFDQLEPVVLIAADGYRYGGRVHDRTSTVAELRGLLPGVREVLWVDNVGLERPSGTTSYDEVVATPGEVDPVPVPFDHPLWVLYSSGTTGRPKGIVHGHGGILLEQVKLLGLHHDLRPGSRFFWFTTTSWMMWNVQVSGLLLGATIFLFDGSPTWPGPEALWRLVADQRLDCFGTSAAFLLACQKRGVDLAGVRAAGTLKSLGSTGSPLPPSCARWIAGELPGVRLGAISGGTDVCSAFVGPVPSLPVRASEMWPMLGVAVEAWDADGHPLVDEVGELVITQPMPSMPVGFWGDADGQRYHDAYFATFPGVWRHGDWATVTRHGGVIIHGRSDATMNRYGVRMGSAEIYEAVERLYEVAESLVIGIERSDGGYWMPLFVRLAPGVEASDSLVHKVKQTIRAEVSPRHVPDEVIVVDSLPHTLTGKRLEVPIKRILQGTEIGQAVNPRSVDDPAALDWFVDFARSRRPASD